MPSTVQVYDRWRSSTPSLSSPILFELCKGERTVSGQLLNNSATSAHSKMTGSGAWQGGDYDGYLDSCDSSIAAWSEDGHKSHIDNKKKKQDSQKRKKRSSAVVDGTLLTRTETGNVKRDSVIPSIVPEPCSTPSSSFASPLQFFPMTPPRGPAGRLVTATASSPPQSPVTPKGYLQHQFRLPQQGRLVVKNKGPLLQRSSQRDVDASPLDAPSSAVPSGWTAEGEEEESNGQGKSPSYLIDSLLAGVQRGTVISLLASSPKRFSMANSAASGWETEDCEMTPRLRPKWEQVTESTNRKSQAPLIKAFDSNSDYLAKTPTGRQLSFIRVPSTIFPHTPATIPAPKQNDGKEKRLSTLSTSSKSSRTPDRTRRVSRDSIHSIGSSTQRRQSVHIVTAPRPISRKSKYYSKPLQAGIMPAVVQQRLKGARGTFWSPMNNKGVTKEEKRVSIEEIGGCRKSTRYSRRSGQDWIRPRTFGDEAQFQVTVYPPRVEESQNKKEESQNVDPDKTPTQAEFTKVQVVNTKDSANFPKRRSRSSKSFHGSPPRPPPTSDLPPVPILSYVPKTAKKRSSKASRLSLAQSTSTCSQCYTFSCSCSEYWTETMGSNDSSMQSTDSMTESEMCSCTDISTCTCTATRSSMFGSEAYLAFTQPRSAPLYATAAVGFPFVSAPPLSAPYYSSQRPPILDPLPRLSPLYIDFGHLSGSKRRSLRLNRNSVFTTSICSYTETFYSDCTSCHQTGSSCQECALIISRSKLSQEPQATLTEDDSYDSSTKSTSYDSTAKSPSSRASEDVHSYDSENEIPLTPPRSEYQSSLGEFLESPGYRVSCIVSPMPQSAKRLSQLQQLVFMTSPPASVRFDQVDQRRGSDSTNEGSLSHQSIHTTTSSSNSSSESNITYSPNGRHRIPRSILKTSKYPIEEIEKRPMRSMAVNTLSNSVTSYSHKSSLSSSFSSSATPHHHHRATLATSTLTKSDLQSRIKREENRRQRNDSRLYALEKLEGKRKKSSLFFSLLSNSTTANGGTTLKEWEEDDDVNPAPLTPLTPTKRQLFELQTQLENRQRMTQFQSNEAVSFTDVIGFDMGTYPKMGGSKKKPNDGEIDTDDELKHQLKKLSTAIEARQHAKERCIDK